MNPPISAGPAGPGTPHKLILSPFTHPFFFIASVDALLYFRLEGAILILDLIRGGI